MPNESGETELVDQPKTKTRTPPPYKVILHNDDVNDMVYVVETICKLTPLTVDQAYEKMIEAHKKGLVVLLVCHRERAELYQEQFQSCRLTVTIEPD
jgi:ATP-dependent Clp protease adaptor protein ClpS